MYCKDFAGFRAVGTGIFVSELGSLDEWFLDQAALAPFRSSPLLSMLFTV